jgi:hypothetical protein
MTRELPAEAYEEIAEVLEAEAERVTDARQVSTKGSA